MIHSTCRTTKEISATHTPDSAAGQSKSDLKDVSEFVGEGLSVHGERTYRDSCRCTCILEFLNYAHD